MDQFTRADLNALITPAAGPCVSIFMATHPGGTVDDRPRWKEQVRGAQGRLLDTGAPPDVIDTIVGPAHAFLEPGQVEFWKHARDGMAAFFAPNFARVYRLPTLLTDRVAVGPRFHLTPLLGYVGDDGHFFTLALSRHQVRLIEGTAHTFRRVEVPAMPHNLDESRPAHDRDEPLNLHSHHAAGGTGMQAVFHGQGVGIDNRKSEFLTFSQAIDHAILQVLGEGKAPLVLATTKQLAAVYRQANRYDHLIADIVHGNPDRTSDAELHDQAWALVAPLFRTRTERAVAHYRQLAGTGRTTDRLDELLPALRRGEIETLLLPAGREVAGRFDASTDCVEETAIYAVNSEDLLNVAANLALARHRQIYVVDRDVLGNAPAAGIYFTPMNKHGK